MSIPFKSSVLIAMFFIVAAVAMTLREGEPKVVREDRPKLLLFASPWDDVSKTAIHVHRDIAEKYDGWLDGKVFMAARAPEEMKRHAVRVLPTWIIENEHGGEVMRYEGKIIRSDLEAQLAVSFKTLPY